MKTLDFVVIGASKSGTTSLFRYLARHPSIFLPPDKDAPFFAPESAWEKGWSHHAEVFYRDADPELLWGSVTPRYLEDPAVAGRMAESMPDLHLAAILRNPIDRAYSQFRQQVRRGKEERSFEQLIEETLRGRPSPGEAPRAPEPVIAHGEYGRLLEPYLATFPAERITLAFTEDLAADGGRVLDRLLPAWGLEPGFRPANLETRYHRGGSKERLPGLVPRLKRLPGVRSLWHLLPRRRRRALWVWFFTRANVVAEETAGPSPAARERLQEYYAPDVERLRGTGLVERTPWPEFDGTAP